VFGFLDGIGQPAVAGFNINPLPGQAVVNPGIILVGEPGDTVSRPAWAKDGSFLAFRQLRQLVPEWNNWIYSAAPPIAGFTQQQSADLMAARMIGRWPSVRGSVNIPTLYSKTLKPW
jgi:deferrochelatase/peroxidase EfeB